MNVTHLIRSGRRRVKRSLLPLRNKWATRHRIVASLRQLGVKEGGTLLVHSSLSRLGYVPAGSPSVINALTETLGVEGTLLMPAHSWEAVSAGERTFDVRTTPSCVGAIAEAFRKSSGVNRSLHPTHSIAALGPGSEFFRSEHERCMTPCGEGSPYAKLLDGPGQILLLGVGGASNTCFHTVEAFASVPYLMGDATETFTLIDDSMTSHSISIPLHRPHVARCFTEVTESLLSSGIAVAEYCCEARLLLIDARH
nr:AAC(3) family N-acetyltransferase [Planctomycetota bacterium]